MKSAAFFPGQGSQQVGMGKQFYDEFTVFRQTIEEASDSLSFNLKKLIFDGPEADLTLTQNAQPAILAVSTGCYRVAEMELDYKADVTLGHSLGEYSALVASEAIPFSDSIQWVHERGLSMQKAVPIGQGTMSAILGAEDSQVEEWCKEATALARNLRASGGNAFRPADFGLKSSELTSPIDGSDQKEPEVVKWAVECSVEPANYNAPGQVVVSGSIDAVATLEKIIAEKISEKKIRGLMAKRLNVSAPFHSSLMKRARARMEEIFKDAKSRDRLNALLIPYIPNRTARFNTESSIIFNLLSEQVDHAVLWKQSVETLVGANFTRAFEFGPGKVLQGLAKRIVREKGSEFETHPIYDLETLKLAETLLSGKK
jgi:[acyl-carrier-protein] S-malonyltransferase